MITTCRYHMSTKAIFDAERWQLFIRQLQGEAPPPRALPPPKLQKAKQPRGTAKAAVAAATTQRTKRQPA